MIGRPPAWAADYVGMLFRNLGRDRSGCDCCVLAADPRRTKGLDLPSRDGPRQRAQHAPIRQIAERETTTGRGGASLPASRTPSTSRR